MRSCRQGCRAYRMSTAMRSVNSLTESCARCAERAVDSTLR